MTTPTNKSGFFRTFIDAIVESRRREADRHVNGLLVSLDDETLAGPGHSQGEPRKRPDAKRLY